MELPPPDFFDIISADNGVELASIRISRHNPATNKIEFVEKITRTITEQELEDRYGEGTYELRATKKGGSMLAYCHSFTIGNPAHARGSRAAIPPTPAPTQPAGMSPSELAAMIAQGISQGLSGFGHKIETIEQRLNQPAPDAIEQQIKFIEQQTRLQEAQNKLKRAMREEELAMRAEIEAEVAEALEKQSEGNGKDDDDDEDNELAEIAKNAGRGLLGAGVQLANRVSEARSKGGKGKGMAGGDRLDSQLDSDDEAGAAA
jgi:hypothetical protein